MSIKQMNEILCVSHKYPPAIGGMERQSYELTTGLKKYYNTHIIAYTNAGNSTSTKAIWMTGLKNRLKTFLKNNPNIELIHLNDGSMGALCYWLQKYTAIPVVTTLHGLDITFPLECFQHKLVPKIQNYAGIICVSNYTRNECLRRGFNPDTTYMVHNGVDTSIANIPFDYNAIVGKLKANYGINVIGKHIIVASGRPVRRKGFSWFMRNVLPRLDNDVLFLMTGPMKTEVSFREKVISLFPEETREKANMFYGFTTDAKDVQELLEITPNAYHLGSLPYDELLQLLSLADIFVMPNIHVDGDGEGFGLVALEASVRGTYVLASGIEGITDAVIDGKNGTLVQSENADDWVDKIETLLSDKPRLDRLSKEGQQFTIDNYCWDNMVIGYKQVFDKLIEQYNHKKNS